jgi:hypothetical protein
LPPAGVQQPAILALLESAELQKRAGHLETAAATLERALRIDPNSARLWNRLAEIRLEQEQSGQAESLAAKSNALAGSDRLLKARNWRIIAAARRLRGDAAGAREAEDEAAASAF